MYVPAQPPPDYHDDNISILSTQDTPPLLLLHTVNVGCNPDEEEVITPMDNSLTVAVELMNMLIKNGCHLNMLPQIMKWTLQVASRPRNKTLFQTVGPMMTCHMRRTTLYLHVMQYTQYTYI